MDLKNPKTILVVQIGKIGDMILTTPLFKELKKLFPETRLIVLASEVNKDIPLHLKQVDKVFVYKKNIFRNISLINSELSQIDIWIDAKDGYSKTSEYLVKLFRPGASIGFNHDKKVFDYSLNEFKTGNHAVDINLSPINLITQDHSRILTAPFITLPPKTGNNRKIDSVQMADKITINISAGSESRYIQKNKWVNIIKGINSVSVSSFTLIGLAKDNEIIEYIISNTSGMNISHQPTHDILNTSEAIKNSYIVITPDTSVVHICSAFDIPVLALFPNVEWNLERFSPLSTFYEIIISKEADSIADIKATDVINGFLKLKEKLNSGNAESRTRVRKEDH